MVLTLKQFTTECIGPQKINVLRRDIALDM